MDVDPYGRDNPIGPGTVLSSYKSGGNAVGTGLKYAALVRGQETLDVSGIDAGLAVLVAAHQGQLKQQAADFADTVAGDFIQLASDVGNFTAVFEAFAQTMATNHEDVRDQLMSIADYAGEAGSDGDTAVDHVTIVETDLGRIGQRLDLALQRALAAVGEDGQAASARIDELNKNISGNIQAIVDGANETGDAVRELGIGILTEITKSTGGTPTPPVPDDDTFTTEDSSDATTTKDSGEGTSTTKDSSDATTTKDSGEGTSTTKDSSDGTATKDSGEGTTGDPSTGSAGDAASGGDPDPDPEGGTGDDDASTTNKSDGKVPDVSFVVKAIKAGSQGAEKYARAMADLQRNNDLLALQYQRLATANRLIAVAKVTQAQQGLFAASVTDMAVAVKEIRARWSALRKALTDQAASNAEPARLVPGALKQWQAVARDLVKMKRALTSSDTLVAR